MDQAVDQGGTAGEAVGRGEHQGARGGLGQRAVAVEDRVDRARLDSGRSDDQGAVGHRTAVERETSDGLGRRAEVEGGGVDRDRARVGEVVARAAEEKGAGVDCRAAHIRGEGGER